MSSDEKPEVFRNSDEKYKSEDVLYIGMEMLVQTREERMLAIEEEMRQLRESFQKRNEGVIVRELTQKEREQLIDELTPERSKELLKAVGFTTYMDENGVEQPL